MQKKPKSKIFYGWYIVAAECLIAAVVMGIVYNCYGLFVVPVCEELGFPRQSMALIQTILSFCNLGMSLLAGKLLTRRNTMHLVRIGAVLAPAAYGCYGLVTQEWMLFGIALLVGIGYAFCILPISVIIGNWFEEKRGFALGIALMGSGIGGMLFNVVTGQLLDVIGWRFTYLVLAVCMLVATAPCAFFVLRFCPEDMNLLPLGYAETSAGQGTSSSMLTEAAGYTLAEALRSARFWGCSFMLMLMGFCSTQLSQTNSPRMLDFGYGNALASTVASISLAVMAFGKVVEGKMFDSRLGPKGTTVFAAAAALLHTVALLFCGNRMVIPLIVLGLGFGCAYGSVAPSVVAMTQFGRRDYAAVFGVMNALVNLGSMAGPIFSAAVFDATGSYNIAYYVILAAYTLHAVLAVVFIRSDKGGKLPAPAKKV